MANTNTFPKSFNGVKFGDVGKYNASTDTITHDGLVTWQDIVAIEDYYRYKDDTTTSHEFTLGVPKAKCIEILTSAGLGLPCHFTVTDNQGQIIPNATYLDIPYAVHTESDDTNKFAVITPYEKLIHHLRISLDISTIGDIDLDGTFNDDDYDLFKEFHDYVYSLEDPESVDDLDYWVNYWESELDNNAITKGYQTLKNCAISNNGSHIDIDNDLIIFENMLPDIFGIISFPIDIAVFSNKPANFSITTTKIPLYGNYVYIWKFYKQGSNDEYEPMTRKINNVPIGQPCNYTISSATVPMNGAKIVVSIYEQIEESVPENTPYTDTNYYQSRSYTSFLYVKDANDESILWGDTDGNGFVNIIDAYRILNNFIYPLGDVDKDGKITASDANITLRYCTLLSSKLSAAEALNKLNESRLQPLSLSDIDRGDMDRNGKITPSDASTILGIYAAISGGTSIEDYGEEHSFNFYPAERYAKTLSELNAYVSTSSGSRPVKLTKNCAELILQSIKDNNITLK